MIILSIGTGSRCVVKPGPVTRFTTFMWKLREGSHKVSNTMRHVTRFLLMLYLKSYLPAYLGAIFSIHRQGLTRAVCGQAAGASKTF